MSERGLTQKAHVPPALTGAIPVGLAERVPAAGEQGITQQFFCPLIKSECLKHRCMFFVELHDSTKGEQVGHCAYWWNAVMLTELKDQLHHLVHTIKAALVPAPKEKADAPPA